MTTRLAAILGSCLTLWGCGDAGTTSATEGESTGSLVCEEPDYPTGPDGSCGCYNKAQHDENPYYANCLGLACVMDGQCDIHETPSCLWDGELIVTKLESGGSFCAQPCSDGASPCPIVEGVQTKCSGQYCYIPCTIGCPSGMYCVEEQLGIGEKYCVYDFRP